MLRNPPLDSASRSLRQKSFVRLASARQYQSCRRSFSKRLLYVSRRQESTDVKSGFSIQMNIQLYLQAITATLEQVLCLRPLPSEISQKTTKPEIEMSGYDKYTKPLVIKPFVLARSKKQHCLIQASINSVRVSFALKKNDETDEHICEKFSKFMSMRADLFEILRRKPIRGYDISFLITNEHLQNYDKDKIISFIVDFISNIEKDIAEIRLNINTQTRIAATSWISALSAK